MKPETNGEIDLGTASTEEMTAAIARGVRAALQEHKDSGRSVVVWDWDDRRVVTVPPDRIEFPESPADNTSHQAEVVEPKTALNPVAPAPHHS